MKQKRTIIILAILVVVIALFSYIAKQNRKIAGGPGEKGQLLTFHTSSFPKSFNYYINNTTDASTVFGLIYDTLLSIDSDTLEFQPLIAESWGISSDKKEFTFKIDPKAKWADGKPITSADVQFTYETIMNPKNMTSVSRIYFGRFNPPEVIDDHTIKFTAKTVHFQNFITLAGINVLPKHLFAGKDFNKAFNLQLPDGSGPYLLSEVKEGRYYTLKRNPNYWGYQLPRLKGLYSFDRVRFKVIRDDNVAFEAFKKGDFDVFTDISAKRWVTETGTEHFKNNWIIKQKIYNYAPRGFAGIVFNMRRPLFKDLRVRQGIFLLIDRESMLEKIMYNQYQPLDSYWPSLYDSKQRLIPMKHDPNKAKQLLAEAGFNRLDKEGYLINQDGQRLEFTITYSTESFEKHLTMIANSCRNAGVKVNLELLSWATLLKRHENYEFDTLLAAWTSSLFPDPEQLWHSKHVNEPGGNNLPGYQNSKVDSLIELLPPIFDSNRRAQIIKEIDRIIYNEVPYALLWDADYTRLFYKNIFTTSEKVLSKYTDTGFAESDIITYWRFDPEKINRYNEAIRVKTALPSEPEEVYYNEFLKNK